MISEWWTAESWEKEDSAISRSCLEEVGETLKPSIRIGNFSVEIATRDSPNTSTESNGRRSVTIRVVSYTERVTNICAAAKASNFEAMCVLNSQESSQWVRSATSSQGISRYISVTVTKKLTYFELNEKCFVETNPGISLICDMFIWYDR